jgi:hypothetical protein
MMVQGSWDAIVPSYGDLPIYIPPLKAFLSFGSFVLFKPLNAPEASVGRLVHRDDTQKKIVVSLFDKLSAMVEMEKTVPRLSNETIQGVVEIVCTRKLLTISVEEIQNIAFIFSMETIEQHGIILNGIFNGYMIRF